jgi:hypothetical protein
VKRYLNGYAGRTRSSLQKINPTPARASRHCARVVATSCVSYMIGQHVGGVETEEPGRTRVANEWHEAAWRTRVTLLARRTSSW